MAIPEPEFKITAYQLMKMLDEIRQPNRYETRPEYLRYLKSKCYNHLDVLDS